MGDSLIMKTRFSKEGCKITTVIRKQGNVMSEEIILEAENLRQVDIPTLELQDEDTGRWLIEGG